MEPASGKIGEEPRRQKEQLVQRPEVQMSLERLREGSGGHEAAVGGAEERDTHGGHITQWPVGFVQVFATFFRVVLESRGMT